MKPINRDEDGCTPISSSCVIWAGPDLECINLCKGDSVSDVVFKLATELCDLLEKLNVSTFDLSCLEIENCAPKDIHALIQLLIQRICALEGIVPPEPGTDGCPDCLVNVNSCFGLTDQLTGDAITTLLLDDYVKYLATQICALLIVTGTQQNVGTNHESRIRVLEDEPVPVLLLPSMIPECVLPPTSISILDVIIALEQQFCELRGATGTTTNIYQAISAQCPGLNTAPSLGTHGGTMSSISGWKTTITNEADSINNIWLTLCDLRSAIVNIKANCCATPCNGVAIVMDATMPTPTTLKLYFTGTIPAGMTACDFAGTMFTIADQSGNSINVTINMIANMNNPSGYPIDLSATPIIASDDLTITSTVCFTDATTGTICQSVLSHIFVNTQACPDVLILGGQTTVSYSFSHASGSVTYTVVLYDSTGNIALQSQTQSVTNPVTVSGTFNALTEGTAYKVRVFIITPNRTTTCPLTAVSTLPNPCPPPTTVEAVITTP